jgi:uncharacterized membrane protein
MVILIIGLVIFLGLHSTRIVSERGRERAIARLGKGPWKGIYSFISAIGFLLIARDSRERDTTLPGFGRSRPESAASRCF